ncbi:MAG: hypothetical protein NTY47_02315, partial [Candidatus Omnitrophica bacterium]|nr:hypothetical protein [Candidatus Omnitrophota bacterium]
ALIRHFGFPIKKPRQEAIAEFNRLLAEILPAKPGSANADIEDTDHFHVDMANAVAALYAAEGTTLAPEKVEELRREFSHERCGIDVLRGLGISLTPVEEFLIANHLHYPVDMSNFAAIAQTSGLTAEELKLMLDTFIFCDVFENGNNAQRLSGWRGIDRQELAKTFELSDQFYGNKYPAFSQRPKQEMIKILRQGGEELRSVIFAGRPGITPDELDSEIAELSAVADKINNPMRYNFTGTIHTDGLWAQLVPEERDVLCTRVNYFGLRAVYFSPRITIHLLRRYIQQKAGYSVTERLVSGETLNIESDWMNQLIRFGVTTDEELIAMERVWDKLKQKEALDKDEKMLVYRYATFLSIDDDPDCASLIRAELDGGTFMGEYVGYRFATEESVSSRVGTGDTESEQ